MWVDLSLLIEDVFALSGQNPTKKQMEMCTKRHLGQTWPFFFVATHCLGWKRPVHKKVSAPCFTASMSDIENGKPSDPHKLRTFEWYPELAPLQRPCSPYWMFQLCFSIIAYGRA